MARCFNFTVVLRVGAPSEAAADRITADWLDSFLFDVAPHGTRVTDVFQLFEIPRFIEAAPLPGMKEPNYLVALEVRGTTADVTDSVPLWLIEAMRERQHEALRVVGGGSGVL